MPTPSSQLDRTRFFGRQPLFDRLDELVGTGARACLVGPSGCGKSRLAREFVRHEPNAHYIDLSAATSAEDAEAIMAAVTLDDASLIFFEGQPFGLVNLAPPSATLCRCDEAWGDVSIDVGPLSPDAGFELLVDRVRAGDAEFQVDDENAESVEELLELSGGWPLVIEQLARRLTLFTAAELVQQCRDGVVPWQGLPGSGAWEAEFDCLNNAEWEVLGAALSLPAGFDLALMAEIVSLPSGDVLDAIGGLSEALIIRRVDARGSARARFVVDQSADAAASTRLEQREAGARRVREFWVEAARRLWDGFARDGGTSIVELFRDEQRNAGHIYETARRRDAPTAAAVGAAVFHASRTGWSSDRQDAWSGALQRLLEQLEGGWIRSSLLLAIAQGLRSARRFGDAVDLLERHDADVMADDSATVALLVEYARCLNLVDHFDKAIRLFKVVRDDSPRSFQAARADAHLGIAIRASTDLQFDSAREELAHALVLSREIDAPRTLERSRHAQISVTVAQGDFDAARTHAAAIRDDLGPDADPRRVAGTELQLSDILIELGDFDDALDCIERAEALLDAYGFTRLSGYCEYGRAKVALLRGDAEQSLRLLAAGTESFGDEPAAFLLSIIEEVARTVRDPDSTRPDRQDQLADMAWSYWTPVGVTAELLFIACRRLAGVERDEDGAKLVEARAKAEESGMQTRVLAARMLQGEDVEPRGFDCMVIAAMMPADDAQLRVGAGCRWFEVAGGERVEIAGRKALPELLAAIVEAGGESLDPYELAEAGWPDEELHPETAKNRVYVAVHALRKMGLADLLRTEGGGYALEHDVVVKHDE